MLYGFEDGGPYAFPPSFKLAHDEKTPGVFKVGAPSDAIQAEWLLSLVEVQGRYTGDIGEM